MATATATAKKPKKDKATKLKEIAGKRVTATIKAIQRVGNLGAYGPTGAQVEQITKALREAVTGVEARLKAKQADEPEFQL